MQCKVFVFVFLYKFCIQKNNSHTFNTRQVLSVQLRRGGRGGADAVPAPGDRAAGERGQDRQPRRVQGDNVEGRERDHPGEAEQGACVLNSSKFKNICISKILTKLFLNALKLFN